MVAADDSGTEGELVLETAAFLMGEREEEPALTLAAERLGFISMRGACENRHIDPASSPN